MTTGRGVFSSTSILPVSVSSAAEEPSGGGTFSI
eukprot:CAMPEP_0180222030 /NCGR_PEP_ID=MMETSP0987-20121128/20350_1 /TAXON_ID=697907 /ORGANISM="non described non described, Strain CCMP2293" /LENGTH=33 /DNA_ID= /DNA_START= /DNA_END= /DNA_ORIENTATION=